MFSDILFFTVTHVRQEMLNTKEQFEFKYN